MGYTPRPIDTSAVTLTPDVLALTERLAEHTHDVWALQRLGQGWTYGPRATTPASTTPAWCPTPSCPSRRRSTTARRRWRASRPSSPPATASRRPAEPLTGAAPARPAARGP